MQLCKQALPQEEPTQDDLNKAQEQTQDLQQKESVTVSNSIQHSMSGGKESNHTTAAHSNFHKNAQVNNKNAASSCAATANGSIMHALSTTTTTPNGNAGGGNSGSGAGHHNQNSHKNHRRSLDKDRTTAANDSQHNSSSNSLKSSSSTDIMNSSTRNHTSYHQTNHHSSYRDTSKSSSTTDSSTSSLSAKEKNSDRDKKDVSQSRTNKDPDKDSKSIAFDYHQQPTTTVNATATATSGVPSSKSVDNKTAINGKITASSNTAAADSRHEHNSNSKLGNSNQHHTSNNHNSGLPTTEISDTNSSYNSNEHTNASAAREKGGKLHAHQNGGILHMDIEIQHQNDTHSTHEVIEKTKGELLGLPDTFIQIIRNMAMKVVANS